jgi:hypothetical protein
MKKTLLTSVLLVITAYSFSQNCRLTIDSIASGDEATSVEKYFYDGQNRLVRVEKTDSFQSVYSSYDSLYYNPSTGYLDFTYGMFVGNPTPQETTAFTYNGSGDVILVAASGNNGSPWTMSHNVTYNGSNIAAITIIPSSVTGNPEGMVGSFTNLVWAAGNVISLDLEADLGNGLDTIELNASYDTKNNLERHYPLTGAGDIILKYCNNSMLQLTLANNEPGIGGTAGQVAMQQNLTYNAYNEAATMTEVPGLFDQENSAHDFTYFCPVSVEDISNNNSVSIFPNPTLDVLNIDNVNGLTEIKIVDVTGKIVESIVPGNGSTVINTSKLSSGVYFVRLKSKDGFSSHKFIKE